MPSFFASRGDRCSEPASIDDTEYESTSEFPPGPELDETEEAKEDELKLEQKLPPVIKTSARVKQKAKVKKKSWWRRVWSKRSKKKRKKKKKRKRRRGKSTVSMYRHHHATFAHLIHDAFLRLKCSPIHRYGYSHRQILKNIEQHYSLKLGKKFKVRLQLSFQRLTTKGLVVSIGRKNKGLKYKPSVAFVKKFDRLKVIDGAANRRYGVEIGKYRSNSRGRSRSKSHRRRRKRSHSRRRRRKRRRKKRGRKRSGWKRKGRSHGRAHHYGKKTKSKKGSSTNYFGGSITKWFWPSKEDKVEGEKNTKAEAHNGERKFYSKHLLGKWKRMPRFHKRKQELAGRGSRGHGKGARYRGFQRLRNCEREEKPISLNSKGSLHLSKVDSHSVAPEASEGSLDPIDNFHYETPPSSLSDSDKDGDEDMSNTTSECSTPMIKNRSRREHDILHAVKERSGGCPSKRSFLEKVGDSLRGAFGSDRTSTTTCEEGPSRPQSFSKTPSSSQRPFEIGPKASETSASPSM